MYEFVALADRVVPGLAAEFGNSALPDAPVRRHRATPRPVRDAVAPPRRWSAGLLAGLARRLGPGIQKGS